MQNNKFDQYIKNIDLKKIHSGSIWNEGPCYIKRINKVIWSDIPNNRMLSYNFNKIEIFRSPSNFSNGNTLDNEENLISCEHGGRRLTKTSKENVITLVVDEYDHKRLNSPNDVCVHSNGTIFFTDPPYGIINDRIEGFPGKMMYEGCYVFKYNPKANSLDAIITDMDRPNGIAFSADEKQLFISNTGIKKYIRKYDIDNNLNIKNPEEFARPENNQVFDGFRFDSENNIWTSYGKGVACYNLNGEKIGFLKLPEVVSNVEFGGKEGNILFITATTSFYMATLNIKGAKFNK